MSMTSYLDVPSLFVFFCAALVACFRTLQPTVKRFSVRHCRSCKYDLAGLAKDAPCPECGIETPGIVEERYPGVYQLDGGCLRQCVFLGAVFIVFCVTVDSMQQAIVHELLYIVGRAAPEESSRIAPATVDELNFHSATYLIACTPFALRLKPRERLLGVAMIMVAGIAVGTVQLLIS